MRKYTKPRDDTSLEVSKDLKVEKYNVFEPETEDVSCLNWGDNSETYETKQEYIVKLNLEGFIKDQIHVRINNKNILTVEAKKKEVSKYGETICQVFRRYNIPTYCDIDNVLCDLDRNGLLKIRFRRTNLKSRSISLDSVVDQEVHLGRDAICVSLDIGDFKEDEISVKTNMGNLIIKGKCIRSKRDGRGQDMVVKRKFKRIYIINYDIDVSHIRTKIKNNRLFIELPREHLIKKSYTT